MRVNTEGYMSWAREQEALGKVSIQLISDTEAIIHFNDGLGWASPGGSFVADLGSLKRMWLGESTLHDEIDAGGIRLD